MLAEKIPLNARSLAVGVDELLLSHAAPVKAPGALRPPAKRRTTEGGQSHAVVSFKLDTKRRHLLGAPEKNP
jgi:hypothetical protein